MFKNYDTLYSLDSVGNIRIWFMSQNGSEYTTTSGLEGGQLVTSEPTIASSKNVGKTNETSAAEQATLEIQAKYTKQLKTGYFKDKKDIYSSLYVEPMLAKKLCDRLDKITFPAMLDRKYNGGRIIFTKNGPFSRKGEKWLTVPHIVESLSPIFDKYPDLVLDGEGYNHDFRFNLNDLMSILRKTKNISDSDLLESKNIVKYYVYDCYGFDGVTQKTGCLERRAAAHILLKDVKYITVVDHKIVNDLDEIYAHYDSFINDGYEGAMYRSLNAPYENKRSSHLLKIKPENDSEAVIASIHEGLGNWSGAAKTATLNWRGESFDATFKGTYEQLQSILKTPKNWIGKEVTFLYNGLTGKNIPNFARIDFSNCFKS
jgi:ATP-dependent DNA ligase